MKDWRYLILDLLARPLPAGGPKNGGTVVYSPGHLGDILHVVPMLRALREGKPGLRLIWLVGPWSESLARRYAGLVDEIQTFGPNEPQYTRGHAGWMQSALMQWKMVLELRARGVENLIGPMDEVGRFLANAICPRLWIGIGDRRPPRVRKNVDTMVFPYEKDRYEADAMCGLLAPLEIQAHAERLEYAVTSAEKEEARIFLKSFGVDRTRPLAILAPGSGWRGKNWLPERFGEVARWLREEKGFQVAWVGAKGEELLVPKNSENDFNWVGKTTLPLLAAVLENARLFIGNDGGLLHFAAALNVSTVSIFGPTSPGKWGPRGGCHVQIRKTGRCEGCIYWDYRENCRHDRACMRAVTVEDVCNVISERLKGVLERPVL